MRFIESGPSIPIELLSARDRGEVVFFCGAGVSKPAGMVDFFGLTVQVMKKLGVPADSTVAQRMAQAIERNNPDLAPPFDQVFGQLQRMYTTDKIEREVSALLKTPRNVVTDNHEVVLRLSKDARGAPFVVTTNFDLLFEKAMPHIPRWVPPMLPMMTGDTMHSGIVYLHGRLGIGRQREGVSNFLVLGSADFGRAYLADGWAATFFRQLLERKTVVLLGYSAGDPPIRYLLEGLNTSTSAKLQPIYAFDRGEEHEVSSKWRDLGATGISFANFSDLWDSLHAWARRADNPDLWRQKILSLGRQSPRGLRPYQRGQVAALAATADGASAIAASHPPLHPEWLCVLDRSIRYAEPVEGYGDEETIDAFADYALDDDAPRAEDDKVRGVDFLGRLPSDTEGAGYVRLARVHQRWQNPLPRRLSSLALWFEAICHEPLAIWWAAQQSSLHPDIVWGVNRRMTGHGNALPETAQRIWALLLEAGDYPDAGLDDRAWFSFVARLRLEGWSTTILRTLEATIRPRLKIEATRRALSYLQGQGVELNACFRLSVHCPPRYDQNIDVPPVFLPRVVSIVNRALERAADLLEETGRAASFVHLPAIDPEPGPGRRHIGAETPGALFLFAIRLFRRLAEADPQAALQEMARWPQENTFFFDKFRMFAWKLDKLVPAHDVSSGIVRLDDRSFWDAYLERDLLHALKVRWNGLSMESRSSIEARICNFAGRSRGGDSEDGERVRRYQMGSRLGWLERNGCLLSPPTSAVLATIRNAPDWSERIETESARDMDSRSGYVQRKTDPAGLAGLPLSEIVARSLEVTSANLEHFVEYAPFDGLVAERPGLALAALASESRSGRYPVDHWQRLLSCWPETASLRETSLCGLRLARLPFGVQIELRYYLPDWILKHYVVATGLRPQGFFQLWDAVFGSLQNCGEEATKSAIAEVSTLKGAAETSRKSVDHAYNGPIGTLVRALLKHTDDLQPAKNAGLPSEIKFRLARALEAVGEGADHAASLVAGRLETLFHVDRHWTRKTVLPLFDLGHDRCEAAWTALLFHTGLPISAELFATLKPGFLRIFAERRAWLMQDRDERLAVNALVSATLWNRKNALRISDRECRAALQSIDDVGRQTALWAFRTIVANDPAWRSLGKRFFAKIWPQEDRFQTAASSDTMLTIASDHPQIFADVIETIGEILRPVDHPEMTVYRQTANHDTEPGQSLAKQWPRQVLHVTNQVIALRPSSIPYGLAGLLEDIAESLPDLRSTLAFRRLQGLVTG